MTRVPAIYQLINGIRRSVNGRFELRGVRKVGFSIAEYDRTRLLVIDLWKANSLVIKSFGSSMAQ